MNKEIQTPLSPGDIHVLFNKVTGKSPRIIDTNLIDLTVTLDDLFLGNIEAARYNIAVAKKNNYIDNLVILFTPISSNNNGHFQCMYRNVQSNVYFFDSYGKNFNYLVHYVNKNSQQVHLNNNFLDLLNRAKTSYNTFPYQSKASDDDTCGYHSTVAGLYAFANNFTTDFVDYHKFITGYLLGKKGEFSYDDIVLQIFNKLK